MARIQTHCKRGHLYAPETTWTDARGRRKCKLCRREGLEGAPRTTCGRGHPWIAENLVSRSDGRQQCRVCKGAAIQGWVAGNRPRVRGRRRARNDRLRAEATRQYGNSCARCGVAGTLGRELQLDHIGGGGNNERRKLTSGFAGVKFYEVLKKLGWPSGYQSLCAQCHWQKTWTENRGKDDSAYRRWADRTRAEATDVYGNTCAMCGLEGWLGTGGLTLDHVNRDGASHRRSLGGTPEDLAGVKLYSRLRRVGWPREGLQVLCWECHQEKTRREQIR